MVVVSCCDEDVGGCEDDTDEGAEDVVRDAMDEDDATSEVVLVETVLLEGEVEGDDGVL